MTVLLNSRWITRKFETVAHPKKSAVKDTHQPSVHSPPRPVSENRLLSSPVLLPENDDWWRELTRLIDYEKYLICF